MDRRVSPLGARKVTMAREPIEIDRDKLRAEVRKLGKRKPRLSDLRESGAIEQDADFVGLLYKPKEDDEGEAELILKDGGPVQVNLLIAKHRNGPIGEVRLTFFKAYTRFESAAPIDEADLPGPNQQAVNAARALAAGGKARIR